MIILLELKFILILKKKYEYKKMTMVYVSFVDSVLHEDIIQRFSFTFKSV